MFKMTRRDAGYYEMRMDGRTCFAESIERASEGEQRGGWRLMEATDEGYKGWWNDFRTLKECKIAFIEELMLERWCWLRESDIDI